MVRIEEVVAANLSRVRRERGWTQAQLADRLKAGNLRRFSAGALGAAESGGQRADRLLDLVALCEALGVGLAEFLAGDGSIDAPDGGQVPLTRVRDALAGRAQVRFHLDGRDSEELGRVAARIDLDAFQLMQASQQLFGSMDFIAVRNDRATQSLDDASGPASPRTLQALRGRATRTLLAEVQQAIQSGQVDPTAGLRIGRNPVTPAELDADWNGQSNAQ